MKNLLIIGARGFGREVYNTAVESLGYKRNFIVKGFLDDKETALDDYKGYPPIISSVEDYTPQKDDVFICALGEVSYKKKYTEIILSKGGEFINIIHRDVYIGSNTKLGVGCFFASGVKISCDVRIGNFVTMNFSSVVGHDAQIGDFSHLNSMSFMGGFSILEECSTLHTSAILLPHKKIGKHSVVGAGAMVYKNVKENTTVFGNPAQEL
jgi:sugar O-acyltransferase (sialic acid O-acetyltransferase NeuD family)